MFKKINNTLITLEVKIIAISLLITTFISALIGVGGYWLTGSFLGYFLIAFGVQFVIFFIINTILQKKDSLEEAEVTSRQLEALSKYLIKLSCAYCSKPNTTPVVLNRENRFKCEFCQQVSGVKMQFLSTQITTPIEKVILPATEDTVLNKVS